MLALLIATAVTAALAVGFAFGVDVRAGSAALAADPSTAPTSACRYPGPPLEPARQSPPARVR